MLILVAGEAGQAWPSVRSTWLAAIVLSALVLRLPAPARRRRAGATLAEAPSDVLGTRRMSRRNLLNRILSLAGVAFGAGVALPLARAFVCTHTAPCASAADVPAFGSGESDDPHLGSVERSPCKIACSEQRVVGDAEAGDDLDTSSLEAGSDDAQLLAVAGAFRNALLGSATDFQRCALRC